MRQNREGRGASGDGSGSNNSYRRYDNRSSHSNRRNDVDAQCEILSRGVGGFVASLKESFGFLKVQDGSQHDGQQLFFHFSQVIGGAQDLRINDEASFDIGVDPNGKTNALSVKVLAKGTLSHSEVIRGWYSAIVEKALTNQTIERRKGEAGASGGVLRIIGKVESPDELLIVTPVVDTAPISTSITTHFGNVQITVEPNELLIFDAKGTNEPTMILRSGDTVVCRVMVQTWTGIRRAQSITLRVPNPDGREQGQVAFFKDSYGFIECSNRELRTFFHASHLLIDMNNPSHADDTSFQIDDEVEFDLWEEPKQQGKVNAIRIQKLVKGTIKTEEILPEVMSGAVIKELRGGLRGTRGRQEDLYGGVILSTPIGDATDVTPITTTNDTKAATQGERFTFEAASLLFLGFPLRIGDIVSFKILVKHRLKERVATEVKLIRPSNGSREVGVVDDLRVSYGFLELVDKDLRLFFHFSQIVATSKDEKGNTNSRNIVVNVGDEVEFDVVKDSLSKKPVGERLLVLPAGSVLKERTLEGRAYGTVVKAPRLASGAGSKIMGLLRKEDLIGGRIVLDGEMNDSANFVDENDDDVLDNYDSQLISKDSDGEDDDAVEKLEQTTEVETEANDTNESTPTKKKTRRSSPRRSNGTVIVGAPPRSGYLTVSGRCFQPNLSMLKKGDRVSCVVVCNERNGFRRAEAVAVEAPSAAGRHVGVIVAWKDKDISGFIECYSKDISRISFLTSELIAPSGPRVLAPLPNEGDGAPSSAVPLAVGDEVSFDLIAESPHRRIAVRLLKLPAGTLTSTTVIATCMSATVAKELRGEVDSDDETGQRCANWTSAFGGQLTLVPPSLEAENADADRAVTVSFSGTDLRPGVAGVVLGCPVTCTLLRSTFNNRWSVKDVCPAPQTGTIVTITACEGRIFSEVSKNNQNEKVGEKKSMFGRSGGWMSDREREQFAWSFAVSDVVAGVDPASLGPRDEVEFVAAKGPFPKATNRSSGSGRENICVKVSLLKKASLQTSSSSSAGAANESDGGVVVPLQSRLSAQARASNYVERQGKGDKKASIATFIYAKGPDGTKGFGAGRGRILPSTTGGEGRGGRAQTSPTRRRSLSRSLERLSVYSNQNDEDSAISIS